MIRTYDVLSLFVLLVTIHCACGQEKSQAEKPPLNKATQTRQSDLKPSQPLQQSNTAPYRAPKLLKRVDPKYPPYADACTSGTLILEATITESGGVSDVQVLQPLKKPCDDAVIEAVKQWQYKPAIQDGRAISAKISIPIKFKLE